MNFASDSIVGAGSPVLQALVQATVRCRSTATTGSPMRSSKKGASDGSQKWNPLMGPML
jgi:hypothetical protein